MTMQEHLNPDTERKREIQRVKEVADNNNGFLSGSLLVKSKCLRCEASVIKVNVR